MATKICPDCKMAIDEEASVCPYCQRKFDLRPVYNERRFKTACGCCFFGLALFIIGLGKDTSGFWESFLYIIGGIILFAFGVTKFKQWVRIEKSK